MLIRSEHLGKHRRGEGCTEVTLNCDVTSNPISLVGHHEQELPSRTATLNGDSRLCSLPWPQNRKQSVLVRVGLC